jgi:hypothetical protein
MSATRNGSRSGWKRSAPTSWASGRCKPRFSS